MINEKFHVLFAAQGRMVYENKKHLEVQVRMDSIGEGRPLKCESSV